MCTSKKITATSYLLCLLLSLSQVSTAQQKYRENQKNKISQKLRQKSEKIPKRVRVYVKDEVAFRQWQQQYCPHLILQQAYEDIPTLFVIEKVDEAVFQQLVNCPFVKYIDQGHRTPTEELEQEQIDFSANHIRAAQAQFPELTGVTRGVSIKEDPFDKNDIDFKGRIIGVTDLSEDFNAHATAMTTLVAGAGNTGVQGKGVAWQAQMASASFERLLPDDGEALIEKGIAVQNHSYGVGIENFYGIEAMLYDQHTRDYPTILHVFSSGNEGQTTSEVGTYQGVQGMAKLTGEFKNAKNTLIVGGIDRFNQVEVRSSKGPTADGRIKPELVAFGDGGTSEAAALVSGVALLVQEAYDKQEGALPPAALVKAALLNSADDVGAPAVDFASGFGKLDAVGALETITAHRYNTGEVIENETVTYNITVPAGNDELKVTLVWHDLAADASAEQVLVNDLDLTVRRGATTWLPWGLDSTPTLSALQMPAVRKADHLNNVEQVTIASPAAGTYQIQVSGYNIESGTQPFSIAYEYESGFRWFHPYEQATFEAGLPQVLRWQWKGAAQQGQLAYKRTEESEWEIIETTVDLTQQYYVWEAPQDFTEGQFRFQIEGVDYLSPIFTVFVPVFLETGFNCQDDFLLQWLPEPGAEGYQLYKVGEKFLEPTLTTTDTLLLLSKQAFPEELYTIAPIYKGQPLAYSATVNYTQLGVGCYVRSFLLTNSLNDTISFNLTLGTTYELKEVSLERWEGDRFVTVGENIQLARQMLLTDTQPIDRLTRYRAKLVTEQGLIIYSDEQTATYLAPNELVLAPNPVVRGRVVAALTESDEVAQIQIHDYTGRLLTSFEEFGEMKPIDTRNLRPGGYIVSITLASGITLKLRLIVL
ncbi:MAG: S8 family serine peptidase [Thermonemataceae bacterium]